ncbi:hypothetical protein GCM10027446_32230 [Angustibacter peucedani]
MGAERSAARRRQHVAESPRATVVQVARVVSVLFVVLAVAHVLNLTGGARVALVALTLAFSVAAAGVAVAAARRLVPRHLLEPALTAVVALPVVHSLVHVAVTGFLRQTIVLMLTVVGMGAVVTSRRVLVALVGPALAVWLVVVALGPQRELAVVEPFVLGLALAAYMAYVVHGVRARAERSLREGAAQLDAQVAELTAARERVEASEQRYHGVFEDSPVGIGLADEHGHFVEVNHALATLLGRSPEELFGRSSREFTHVDDLAMHGRAQQLLAASEDGVLRVEKRYRRPDGELVWAWLTITAVPGPQGQQWTLAHVQDVTDRKQAELELQHSREDLAAVADVARCGQSGLDPRPVVVEAVKRLAGAHSVALAEADGDDLLVTASAGIPTDGTRIARTATSASVHAFNHGERVFIPDITDNPLVNPALAELTGTRSTLVEPVRSDGVVVAVLVVGWTHPVTSLEDRAAAVVGTIADETGAALTAQVLRSQLQSLATTDPLTGLVNRRGWYERLQLLTAQSRRTGEPLTLALADLDHFKAYNDEFGHETGDQLLRAFADASARVLREVDVVARWGGEEFAIALPGCDAEQAVQALDRLRLAVPGAQTCSFGIATWDTAETVTAGLKRADDALYRAKAAGRNRIAS